MFFLPPCRTRAVLLKVIAQLRFVSNGKGEVIDTSHDDNTGYEYQVSVVDEAE